MRITLTGNDGSQLTINDSFFEINEILKKEHEDTFTFTDETDVIAWAKAGDYGQPNYMRAVIHNIQTMLKLYPETLQQLLDTEVDIYES